MKIWRLTRQDDGLEIQGITIHQLVQKLDGVSATEIFDPIDLKDNGNVVVDLPNSPEFTWATTLIEEILEQSTSAVKFKTQNSTYVLTRIDFTNE